LGIGEAQVSRWRRGLAVPTVHSLQRLAETLGVPRARLDRLAGYPAIGAIGAIADEAQEDQQVVAELRAYQAILGDLLEQRVPRDLWHVYVEGCSALADALGRSFSGMLERAGIDPRTIAGGDSDRPAERLGFQEPRQHESEDSGEQHGNPDRH
jgi:transcriptional regulator with XRE-family HTH domain